MKETINSFERYIFLEIRVCKIINEYIPKKIINAYNVLGTPTKNCINPPNKKTRSKIVLNIKRKKLSVVIIKELFNTIINTNLVIHVSTVNLDTTFMVQG
jgi:hypothetical protein